MMRTTKDGRQPKITNLDLAKMAIDEDVVALEISVDYWGIVTMQKGKAFKDLATPIFNSSHVDSLVLLSEPIQKLQHNQIRIR